MYEEVQLSQQGEQPKLLMTSQGRINSCRAGLFKKMACACKRTQRVSLLASFDSQLPRKLFIFRLVALVAMVVLKKAVSLGAFLPCERVALWARPRS